MIYFECISFGNCSTWVTKCYLPYFTLKFKSNFKTIAHTHTYTPSKNFISDQTIRGTTVFGDMYCRPISERSEILRVLSYHLRSQKCTLGIFTEKRWQCKSARNGPQSGLPSKDGPSRTQRACIMTRRSRHTSASHVQASFRTRTACDLRFLSSMVRGCCLYLIVVCGRISVGICFDNAMQHPVLLYIPRAYETMME